MKLSVSLIIVSEQHLSGTIVLMLSDGVLAGSEQCSMLYPLCQFKRLWQSLDLDNLYPVISVQVSFGSPCLPITWLFFLPSSFFPIPLPVELLFGSFIFSSLFLLKGNGFPWDNCLILLIAATKSTFCTTLHIFNAKQCVKNCAAALWRIH